MFEDPKQLMIEIIRENQKIIQYEATAFLILGSLFLIAPVFFALALNIILGLLCLFSAGIIAGRIAKSKNLPNTSSSTMNMILYLLLGLVLVSYPMGGVLTLNVLLACFFLLDGIFKLTSSIQMRPAPRWGWIFFSGFLSFLLGILIVMAVPEGSAWILGMLLGINLIITGLVLLGILKALPKP